MQVHKRLVYAVKLGPNTPIKPVDPIHKTNNNVDRDFREIYEQVFEKEVKSMETKLQRLHRMTESARELADYLKREYPVISPKNKLSVTTGIRISQLVQDMETQGKALAKKEAKKIIKQDIHQQELEECEYEPVLESSISKRNGKDQHGRR